MPNYCNYSMRVVGRPEDVDFFIRELNQDYDYAYGVCSDMPVGMRHFCRVFEANERTSSIFREKIDKNNDVLLKCSHIDGDCAWSVASCMMGGPCSYYNDLKIRYGNNSKATTLRFESARLNLIIELYSEEPGCCFSEHIMFVNGEGIINDCVDYYERWYDENDEELIEPIIEGGYDDWSFNDGYNEDIAKVIFSKYGGVARRGLNDDIVKD